MFVFLKWFRLNVPLVLLQFKEFKLFISSSVSSRFRLQFSSILSGLVSGDQKGEDAMTTIMSSAWQNLAGPASCHTREPASPSPTKHYIVVCGMYRCIVSSNPRCPDEINQFPFWTSLHRVQFIYFDISTSEIYPSYSMCTRRQTTGF